MRSLLCCAVIAFFGAQGTALQAGLEDLSQRAEVQPLPGPVFPVPPEQAEPGTILLEPSEAGSSLSFSRAQLAEWLCPGPAGGERSHFEGPSSPDGTLTTEIAEAGARFCQTAQDYIQPGQQPSVLVGKETGLEVLPFQTSGGGARQVALRRLCLEGYEVLDVCGRWLVDARLEATATGSLLLLSGQPTRQGAGTALLSIPVLLGLTFTNMGNGRQVFESWPLSLFGTAPWTTEPGPDAFHSAISFQTPSASCIPEASPLTVPPTSNIFLGWRALETGAAAVSFCLQDSQGNGRICLSPALAN